ncbi:BA14K family protein [Inquilinus sp. YAF38]|uniref:BA14K family protein n=1 Tax=Inquilinus sp. YAF38 TaxID=3233084 RepID=UPI003F8E2DC1
MSAPSATTTSGVHQQRLQQRRAQRRQTDQTLTPHQRACAQRYRSYNPATDSYIPRPGVTARCRL